MLEGGGAVAALGLLDLVRLPAALDREHGELLAAVGEQQPLADRDAGVVAVEDDRQAEQQAAAGAVRGNHGFVVLLVHEATQGREAPHHQQLHVTGVAIAALDAASTALESGLALVGGQQQIHQGTAMGRDQPAAVGAQGGFSDRHTLRTANGGVGILPDQPQWPWSGARTAGRQGLRDQGTKKGALAPRCSDRPQA